MTISIDRRLVRVSIEIGEEVRTYENLAITASGQKFTNPNQGECNITIAGLSKEVSDYILSETTPFNQNRVRKGITLEVGRESYGTTILYQGDIFRSQGGERPENIITLRCLTGQFNKGTLVTRSAAANDSLKRIAQGVASDNGLRLDFQGPDKRIASYSFSGAAAAQIDKLRSVSGQEVYVDGQTLVVKQATQSVDGATFIIDSSAGLQVPKVTEQGIKATFLFDPRIRLGSAIEIRSSQFPATNGRYIIYKLAYNIANRDTPFHYTAEARRA